MADTTHRRRPGASPVTPEVRSPLERDDPVDADFWFFDRKGGVLGRCKACWSERVRDEHGRKSFTAVIA